VLRCSGDEDHLSQVQRRASLARARCCASELSVDLSDLSFADPSLMVDLAMLARRLRRRGSSLRLCGAQPQILALIEHVGLQRLDDIELEPHPA
jgi:anti-anti-sigma regulatory factor